MVSPIRFVYVTASSSPGKINFNDVPYGGGCSAELGYRSNYNDIWIDTRCTEGNIIHEIGHALGFIHEHQRKDREGWININWPNIRDDDSFTEQSGYNMGRYDYLSVMHYPLRVGTPLVYDSNVPAMTVPADKRDDSDFPSGVVCDAIGQRCGLSQRDLNGVVNRYSRYGGCTTSSDTHCEFTGGTLSNSDTSDVIAVFNSTARRRHEIWVRSDDYSTRLTHQIELDKKNSSGAWVNMGAVGNGSNNILSIDRVLDPGTYRYVVRRQGTTQGAYDSYRTYFP